MNTDKTITRKRSWTIEMIEYSDGTGLMNRTNDGFSPLELLGLSSLLQVDITKQVQGEIKPTKVIRKVVVRK